MVVSGWVRQAFEKMFGERTEEIIRLTMVMVRELGGVNVSFEISGVNDTDKVVAAIKERLSEVTNQIATKLSDQMADAFGNMAVHH